MDTKDLVSVIIPCYNSGKHIQETVACVLKQTYRNVEIIIVDDGSVDAATLNYLNSVKLPAIKVYLKEHEGVSAARNYGIEHATGDYILPLDADDLISEDYLELAVAAFQQNPGIKLVACKVKCFGYKNGSLPITDYTLEKLLARNLFVVSSLFKRSDFLHTKGFNPNMKEGLEDWDFWISLLKTGGDVYRIEKTCFYYRIHKKSRNNRMKDENIVRLRKQIYENHREVYATCFFNPMESIEHVLISNSMEYRVGKLLLKPYRIWQRIIHG